MRELILDLALCVGIAIAFWGVWQSAHVPVDKRDQSLKLQLGSAFMCLAFCALPAIQIRTDVGIDRWSAEDWTSGGAMVLGVYLAGVVFGQALQLWRQQRAA